MWLSAATLVPDRTRHSKTLRQRRLCLQSDSRRVWCDRDSERKRGGGKGRGVNLVCVNADLFLQHFGAGRSIHIVTGWWEFVGGGKEVTARRGDKSAWILQLFVVL